MALENFTTNVIILGVENQIMTKLPDLLTTDAILQLDGSTLEMLAGESEDVKIMREELQSDISKLEHGLEQCKEWRRVSKCESSQCQLMGVTRHCAFESMLNYVSV